MVGKFSLRRVGPWWYTWQVWSEDGKGNESEPSPGRVFYAGPDRQRPSKPELRTPLNQTRLECPDGYREVELMWYPASDSLSGIKHYELELR